MRMIVALLFFMATAIESVCQYSAMTYNIRYATELDGENSWEHRKYKILKLLEFYEPDILGIQEGLHHQVEFLDSLLINYSYVGVARDDGKKIGEYAAIYFNNNLFEVHDSGTFWLSPTPDIPSYGWGANYRRICTWIKLRIKKTDQKFFVFNAHFDHESHQARIESAKLIHRKAKDLNGNRIPLLFMGDLNAIPNSKPITFLDSVYRDARKISKIKPFGPIGTYNGFNSNHPLDRRIDYIFVDDKINVEKYAVFLNSPGNNMPSDHLPVYILFHFE